MRWLAFVLGACAFSGCAAPPTQVVRRLDSCKATEVIKIEHAETPTWKVSCINRAQEIQEVFFHKPVSTDDEILYAPYKEYDLGDVHGYIESVNGSK